MSLKGISLRQRKQIKVPLHNGECWVPESKRNIVQDRESRFGAQWQSEGVNRKAYTSNSCVSSWFTFSLLLSQMQWEMCQARMRQFSERKRILIPYMCIYALMSHFSLPDPTRNDCNKRSLEIICL